jgi:RimJ/RimL family protein N-acetyltransferase
MIGILGVFSTDPVAEVGYTFHPDYWGRGYATEALTAFMERYWVDRPDVKVVVGKCDVENGASGRVLEKAGFVRGEALEGEGKRRGWIWRCFRLGGEA